MSYKVFQALLDSAEKLGLTDQYSAKAVSWFRSKAETTRVTPSSIIRTAPKKVTRVEDLIGSMILFGYTPKTKETLPYYDSFPVIFIVDIYPDGFAGLNLHYLPIRQRAQLLDALMRIAEGSDENKLELNYELLKTVKSLKHYKPCYKRYLNNFTVTNYVPIERNLWNIAMFLPLARFQKANMARIHKESLKKVANG